MTITTAPRESPLLALPTELLVQIFQSAPSFRAVTNLAASSKQLYDIWRQYLTPIYNEVSRSCIPNQSALLSMLADLEKISLDTHPLTLDHIACVVRESRRSDALIKGYTLMHPHLLNDPQTPTSLSPPEERRLVRGMYQLIGLLSLDKRTRDKRVKEMDLKTLFLLSDFTCVIDPYFITMDSDFDGDPDLRAILEEDSVSIRFLQRDLRAQRNKVFEQMYGRRYRPVACTPFESGGRHAWWCDCQQKTFKEMLTGRVFGEKGAAGVPKVRDDLWYDSAEE
ncbi:uncharacterized protein BDW70DRAFT_106785 [Aspergillus foveolatus]|uniref:uncharacterized protein n=1 Tax=Aspergillus foveolatus TaxID=210207 RepID=UPI003CCCD4E5